MGRCQARGREGIILGLTCPPLSAILASIVRLEKSIIRRNFLFSIGFGVAMGIVFPVYSGFFVTYRSVALKYFFIAGCIVAGICVGFTAFYITKLTVVRVVKMVTRELAVIAAGKGDLTRTIDVNSDDEIGLLAKNFNRFVSVLRIMVDSLKVASDRTKAVGVELTGIASSISEKTREMSGTLDTSREHMARSHDELEQFSMGVHRIAQSVAAISQSIDDQAAAVHQSSASVSQIAELIKRVTETTTEKKELADALAATAQDGLDRMREAVASVSKIAEFADETSRIIALMQDVSDQIELYAINAAIEAAHAGSVGKGFAVVASEIRKLSEVTRQHVSVIGGSLKQTVTDIRRAEQLNSIAGGTFGSLTNGIHDIADAINDITAGMMSLSDGSQEIVQSTNTLLRATDSISAATRDTTSSFNSLDGAVAGVRDSSAATVHSIDAVSEGAASIAERMLDLFGLGQENERNLINLNRELGLFKTGRESDDDTQT